MLVVVKSAARLAPSSVGTTHLLMKELTSFSPVGPKNDFKHFGTDPAAGKDNRSGFKETHVVDLLW